MRCELFERRLHRLLDVRQQPHTDATLCEHARGCENCRRVLETQQLLFRDLSATLAPREDAKPTKHNSVSAWQMNLGFSTLAASLLLVVGLAKMLSPNSQENAPVTTDSYLSGGSQFGLLGNNAAPVVPASSPSDFPAVGVERPFASLSIDHLIPEFDTDDLSNANWLGHVREGIRPLANSMTSTLNVLRRTLPGTRHQQRPDPPRASSVHRQTINVV